jgi:hypothetical protein
MYSNPVSRPRVLPPCIHISRALTLKDAELCPVLLCHALSSQVDYNPVRHSELRCMFFPFRSRQGPVQFLLTLTARPFHRERRALDRKRLIGDDMNPGPLALALSVDPACEIRPVSAADLTCNLRFVALGIHRTKEDEDVGADHVVAHPSNVRVHHNPVQFTGVEPVDSVHPVGGVAWMTEYVLAAYNPHLDTVLP